MTVTETWFALLPDHWSVEPIKYCGEVTLGKMLQSSESDGRDVEAPYMRAANVQPDGVLAIEDKQSMWFGQSELASLDLRTGDVVVVEGGVGGYGRAAYLRSDLPGWGFQNSINRIRPTANNDGRFIAYCLLAARRTGYITAYCNVVSMPHLTAEKLSAMRLPRPDRREQTRIADYLDRETAKIDALVSKQEQLIATLRERRGALVDKQFSGLGRETPRLQLRRSILFLTSGSRGWGDYYADEGERFLRIGNLPRTSLQIRGDVQFVDLPAGVTEGSRTRLQRGDLLFSITAYLGSVAEVDSAWDGAYVSQHVALCRLDPRQLRADYAGWFMLTTEGQDQLKQGAAGGTKQQLALDDIRGLVVPHPCLGTQREIAAYLDGQTAKIDLLVERAQRFIEFSKERRSALISAAVTGQIDVRCEVDENMTAAGEGPA